MRNAAFDFSEMTTSVVAVITDVIREGRPVIGYAFNSTGRYACGASMRERFIPRLLSADPQTLLDEAGMLDPAKCAARMQLREKPGGDAERSVPIGTIEVAIWDAVAKALDRPLWRLLVGALRQRIDGYAGAGLCRRWLVSARRRSRGPARRGPPPSRRRLHRAEDQDRRGPARR